MKDLTRRALLRSTPALALPLAIGSDSISNVDSETIDTIPVPRLHPDDTLVRLGRHYGGLVRRMVALEEEAEVIHDSRGDDASIAFCERHLDPLSAPTYAAERKLMNQMNKRECPLVVVDGMLFVNTCLIPDIPDIGMYIPTFSVASLAESAARDDDPSAFTDVEDPADPDGDDDIPWFFRVRQIVSSTSWESTTAEDPPGTPIGKGNLFRPLRITFEIDDIQAPQMRTWLYQNCEPLDEYEADVRGSDL